MSQLASIHLAKTGRPSRRGIFRLAAGAALAGLPGCALPERGTPVPSGHTGQATVLGIANERFFPALGIDPSGSRVHCRDGAPAPRARPQDSRRHAAAPASRHLGRRRKRCFRRGVVVRMEHARHAPDLRSGDRHQHRRAHRALRLPRAGLRSAIARRLYRNGAHTRSCSGARSRPLCSTMPWPTTNRCSGPSPASSTTACWRASPRPTIRGGCC